MDTTSFVFQLIQDYVYGPSIGKYRIEGNGGIVFNSSCACSDIYFMNQRAARVLMNIDGDKSLRDILLVLTDMKPHLSEDDIIADIINTTRFMESVKAIYLIKKGGYIYEQGTNQSCRNPKQSN
jgi:hypothetical protein